MSTEGPVMHPFVPDHHAGQTCAHPIQNGTGLNGQWCGRSESDHMQPGVAYMPVPRCDGCKWWNTFVFGAGGCCDSPERMRCATAVASADIQDAQLTVELRTNADFGCVLWEKKA